MLHALATAPDSDLATAFVWIHMLPSDSLEASRAAANDHQRTGLAHFHDPRRLAGRAVAESLAVHGAIIWDGYLFYRSGVEWGALAPPPMTWAHQLEEARFDPSRHRTGADLQAWLEVQLRDIRKADTDAPTVK